MSQNDLAFKSTPAIKLDVWQGKAQLDDVVFDSSDQEVNDLFTNNQLLPHNLLPHN